MIWNKSIYQLPLIKGNKWAETLCAAHVPVVTFFGITDRLWPKVVALGLTLLLGSSYLARQKVVEKRL